MFAKNFVKIIVKKWFKKIKKLFLIIFVAKIQIHNKKIIKKNSLKNYTKNI